MKNRIAMYGRWVFPVVFLLAAGIFYCRSADQPEVFLSETMESSPAAAGADMQASAPVGSGQSADGVPDTWVGNGTDTAAETALEHAGTAQSFCYVHVCGEVVNPGVYKLSEGSRVYEAVELAGGFAESAAQSFVNLAEPVSDGMKIEIPDEERAAVLTASGSVPASGVPASSGSGAADRKVNINQADRAALMTLKGIGEARAEAILQYREEHGAFGSIEDIMLVPGIKDAAFQKIKDDIMV